jgi:hypothetical protein
VPIPCSEEGFKWLKDAINIVEVLRDVTSPQFSSSTNLSRFELLDEKCILPDCEVLDWVFEEGTWAID